MPRIRGEKSAEKSKFSIERSNAGERVGVMERIMARLTVAKAAQMLLAQDRIIILCHRYPDGDTVGSAFALCRALRGLGKKANVMCGDILPTKFDYIFKDIEPDKMTERYVVAVDVADPGLLGVLQKDYGARVDMCIDHHASNRMYAKDTLLDDAASATGEIIYELLKPLGAELTQDIALALYTAISTDTGCFRYSNVTPRTHRITAKLLETGIDAHEVNRVMFETKSHARMELEKMLLESLDYRMDGQIVMMTLTESMIDETGVCEGDIDGLSAIPRGIEGVKVGVMLREVSNGYKISVRTMRGVNACEICKRLGGGGHAAAAGCFIKGSIDEAKDKMLEASVSELEKSRV